MLCSVSHGNFDVNCNSGRERMSLYAFVSEGELTFTFAIGYRKSVCRLSVRFVHPT